MEKNLINVQSKVNIHYGEKLFASFICTQVLVGMYSCIQAIITVHKIKKTLPHNMFC